MKGKGRFRVDIGDCGLYTHLQRTWRIYSTVESGNISGIIIIVTTTEACLNVPLIYDTTHKSRPKINNVVLGSESCAWWSPVGAVSGPERSAYTPRTLHRGDGQEL